MSDSPNVPEVLNHMLEVWNERDPSKICERVDAVFSADVVFIDPANSIVGCDAFEKRVQSFRARLPEVICGRSSGVDRHHGLHRYHWEIHQGDQRLIEGFDVTEVDADGRVSRVEGFFGPIPQR